MPYEQLNQSLYLLPEQLTANEANEKARPAERPEDRQRRVADMAESILAVGQELPVLVVEKEDDGVTTYEYVDGGCRVEAIAALNEAAAKENGNGVARKVWCSLVEPGEDLFRKAVTANIHRTQNSLLDMGHIVQEAFDRNGWKGRGAGKRVADYLGLSESRVSEYQKILHAPKDIKERMESGELTALSAALALMAMPAEDRAAVATRAVELAAEDAEKDADKAKKKKAKERAERAHNPRPEVPVYDPNKHKPNKPKVTKKHVEQAARERGIETSNTPKAKSEIAEFFEAVSAAAYPKAAVDFADYFVGTWMKGEGTDRHARELFDRAVGVKAAKATKVAKPKAPKAAKAPKPAKAPKKKK